MTVFLFSICVSIILALIIDFLFDFIREVISYITTAIYLEREARKLENTLRTLDELHKGLLIDGIYTVQDGDCLWNISKRFYGKGSEYERIVRANPEITNPNIIYPGQKIKIPK